MKALSEAQSHRGAKVKNHSLRLCDFVRFIKQRTDVDWILKWPILEPSPINAWKRAEKNEGFEPEQHLRFEDLEALLKVLSPGRWVLLKKLRLKGPMSIRALSKELGRDYKKCSHGCADS